MMALGGGILPSPLLCLRARCVEDDENANTPGAAPHIIRHQLTHTIKPRRLRGNRVLRESWAVELLSATNTADIVLLRVFGEVTAERTNGRFGSYSRTQRPDESMTSDSAGIQRGGSRGQSAARPHLLA